MTPFLEREARVTELIGPVHARSAVTGKHVSVSGGPPDVCDRVRRIVHLSNRAAVPLRYV